MTLTGCVKFAVCSATSLFSAGTSQTLKPQRNSKSIVRPWQQTAERSLPTELHNLPTRRTATTAATTATKAVEAKTEALDVKEAATEAEATKAEEAPGNNADTTAATTTTA